MWSFTAYQWDTEEEGYMQVGCAFCSSLERGLFYSIWEETCIGKRWKVLFTTASPNTLLIPEGCIQDGVGVAFYSSRRLVRDLWHWKMNSELKPMRSNVLSLLFSTKSPLLHPAQLTKWCLMTSSQFFEEKKYKRQPLSAIAPFGFTSKTPTCCMHKLWYCISWNITGQPSTQSWLHQTAAVVLLYAASWLLQGQNHFFSGQKEPSLLPHKSTNPWDGMAGRVHPTAWVISPYLLEQWQNSPGWQEEQGAYPHPLMERGLLYHTAPHNPGMNEGFGLSHDMMHTSSHLLWTHRLLWTPFKYFCFSWWKHITRNIRLELDFKYKTQVPKTK